LKSGGVRSGASKTDGDGRKKRTRARKTVENLSITNLKNRNIRWMKKKGKEESRDSNEGGKGRRYNVKTHVQHRGKKKKQE